jgi:Flp pilus assembly pilin Flp
MFSYLIINLRLNGSQSEKGQDLAEYSMLIGLIALLVVVSLTIIGTSINTIFTLITTAIRNGL